MSDARESGSPVSFKLILILFIFALVGISLMSVIAGYILAEKNILKSPSTTTEVIDTQTTTPESESEPKSNDPILTVVPSPKANPHGKTYYSSKYRFAFYYSGTMPGSNETITVTEVGNKVYLHSLGAEPKSGQSVEVFTKDPDQSLEAAIKAEFLKDIPSSECFVVSATGTPKGIEKADIYYPVPENADLPFFEYGENCPQGYSRSNGNAYFYADATAPDKFFYFSIGQYGIPAYTNDHQTMWQTTFKPY